MRKSYLKLTLRDTNRRGLSILIPESKVICYTESLSHGGTLIRLEGNLEVHVNESLSQIEDFLKT